MLAVLVCGNVGGYRCAKWLVETAMKSALLDLHLLFRLDVVVVGGGGGDVKRSRCRFLSKIARERKVENG